MYYTVQSLFWRRKIGNKLGKLINNIDYSDALVKMKKEFHNSSPIEARKQAFDYYQSIIDVLYDGLHKKYKDDYQARIDLQYYLNSNNDIELGNTTKFKITDDFLNGIEIYMTIDEPLKGKKSRSDNRYCIHGIHYIGYPDRLDEDLIVVLKNLFRECRAYTEYNYPTKNQTILNHFEPIGGNTEFYLQTPFNWDNLITEFKGQKILK